SSTSRSPIEGTNAGGPGRVGRTRSDMESLSSAAGSRLSAERGSRGRTGIADEFPGPRGSRTVRCSMPSSPGNSPASVAAAPPADGPQPARGAPPEGKGLTSPEVLATWLPLAGSWLLMGLELPVVSAAMARLPHATVSLAAYGGVVFPLSLLIESPILMLLTASTALARDGPSYRVVRRFMFTAASLLTVLHVLLAFTPLFDVVAGALIGVPEPVREPARTGLRIMLPWTLSIAYRRTQ